MALSVPLGAVLVSIVIHSLWGGNPVAVKFSLLAFPPLTTAFLRFAIGIACIACGRSWRGVRLLPEKGEWRALWIVAVLFAVQIGLMNVGFDHTTGAMGSVLIATNPLFAVMFAHFLIAGDRMTPAKALGLAVAMAGTSLALLEDSDIAVLESGAAGNWIVLSSAVLLGFPPHAQRAVRAPHRAHQGRHVADGALAADCSEPGRCWLEEIAWDHGRRGADRGAALSGRRDRRRRVHRLVSPDEALHAKRHDELQLRLSDRRSGVFSAWLLGDRVGPLLLAGMALVAVGLYLVARQPRTAR